MASRFGPRDLEHLRSVVEDRTPRRWDPEGGQRAAGVLIPLFLAEGEVWVVLTRKSDHLPHHSGQVSFPGGSREPQDASLEATALREAHEEAGIDPRHVDMIGPLDDMPTATTGFVIRPFVGVIPHPYAFEPDGYEVARVFASPLGVFADLDRRRTEHWERSGARHPVYFFDDVDGELVWGATARILVGLIELLDE